MVCMMCSPYHRFYDTSRQISLWLFSVSCVMVCEDANPYWREEDVLDKFLFHADTLLCVCSGGWWQWQWEVPPVAYPAVWQFVYVCLCVWQNKRSRVWLCGHTWVPPTFDPTSEASSKNACSHLHNTQEINTFTPPRCSLCCSLSLGWWESCYYWRRACS